MQNAALGVVPKAFGAAVGDAIVAPPADVDAIPELVADLPAPLVNGTALQAHLVHDGRGLDDLLRFNERARTSAEDDAAFCYDTSIALYLRFRARQAAAMQREALAVCQLFRMASGFGQQTGRALRLLAVMAPGDFMVNTPLDFITQHLNVRLDLMFVVPGQPLPAVIADHDAEFFAAGEADPAMWRRLEALYHSWPRPRLNRPGRIAQLSRDAVARGLADVPRICSPPVMRLTRAQALRHAAGAPGILDAGAPMIIRPLESHAGRDLARIDHPGDLARYLDGVGGDAFFVTRFVDYSGADGMFRKYRIAFIDGAPFLCHMAVSPHWMVHYLNAGMNEHASRRAEEAQAMASFDAGFALRHQVAFAALNDWMDLDYFQIDCAETEDGRLLVFEVDVAAIVHLMEAPELFAYKAPTMRRMFAAFDAMLRRRAAARPMRLVHGHAQ